MDEGDRGVCGEINRMEIRALRETDDKFTVSRIYEESWKYAYKGIVPQEYLDSIPEGHWAPYLDNKEVHTLVAIENGKIIGTSSCCKSRYENLSNWGEIISIYFLPEYMGQGYGQKLLNAAIQELGNMGFDDIFLWALEENVRARNFYEKCGFRESGECLLHNIGGKDLQEIQYRYHIDF